MTESKPCSIHFLNKCPLCSKNSVEPAPLVDPSFQEPAWAVTSTGVFPAIANTTVSPIVRDQHATDVLNYADVYAKACQEVASLNLELKDLESKISEVKRQALKALENRDAAQAELFKLLKPTS